MILQKGDIVETNSYKYSGVVLYGRIKDGWVDDEKGQVYLVNFPPLSMDIVLKEEILLKVSDGDAMLLILTGVL